MISQNSVWCDAGYDALEMRSRNTPGDDLDMSTQANLVYVNFADKGPHAALAAVDQGDQGDRRHRTRNLAGADAGAQYSSADRSIDDAIG